MNVHENARLTMHSRALLVKRITDRLPRAQAAAYAGVSVRTAGKWLSRYRAEGEAGLVDRSSRPRRIARRTPEEVCERLITLRRERKTMLIIAHTLNVSVSTVSRLCAKFGLSSLKALDPQPPIVRYERALPGELIHFDVKKLGCIARPGHRVNGCRNPIKAGWEYAHIAIDDHSRVSFSHIFPDERKESALAFLQATIRYYQSLGIRIDRLMTDNGSAYRSKHFTSACKALGIKQIFTKPYTPRTNGKAERFIQTALREWAYAKTYQNSNERTEALALWLHRYNWHRPHSALSGKTPISRLFRQ